MEGKVKFYLWLLLQNRNWTADRLQARGLPHNDLCCFCDQEKETAEHIALACCFVKEVWLQFQQADDRMGMLASSATSIGEWWSRLCTCDGTKDRNRDAITLAAYIVWNLWKERNFRVFEQKEMTLTALAGLIREDVKIFYEANKEAGAGDT